MRIFFAFTVLTAAALTGCYDMHGSPPVPMGDAGPTPTDDAGLPVIEPDGGPAVTADAGPVIETALRIVFDGPADSAYLRGSQDVVMYHVTLTAYEDVEIRRIPYRLEGLTASDLIVGSSGTEHFRDHKIKDADTGATLAGPGSLPTLPDASSASGPMEFDNSFVVHAGETRHLLVTMDVANTEDAVNELFGDGNNRYRVTVGASDGHFFPLDGVRRVADGSFVEPEAIENNVVISGNEMTIVDAELAVSMAAMPALSTAVSHEPLIPSVGITFTASGASSVLIRSVRLSGVGDLAGAASPDLLNDVITSCALFDGDVQVGLAQSPDAGSGTMHLTNVNVTVPAGSSLTLVARCTADSVVSGEYDTYNLGIANASDVEGEREDGFPVVSVLGLGLIANANAGGPNFVTVYVHGDVMVETDNLRQSTILVAGGDVWHNFAQFRVTALHEDIVMEVVRVTSRGESASFTMVGVAADGRVLGTGILPAGTDSERDITLSSPLTVPRYSSRVFQLWGKLANVVSSASVGGATRGVARSGNVLRLGLAADVESGDWDSSYAGMLNLRFRGTASGDRMTANGPELLGNEFVIRRSKPTFTRQSLFTTRLSSDLDADLYKFRVSADSAGSVGLMGLRFRVEIGGSFSVTNWRIRRWTTDVPLADATITYTGPPSNFVTVTFTEEQIITGSVIDYTLHGTIEGTVLAGDYISVTPYRDLSGTSETGYVSPGLWLDTDAGPLLAGMLWSDLSEVPHSSATRSMGGSMDWINDVYVEDLTQPSTLSR